MKKFYKITLAVLSIGLAATLAGCNGCSSCNNSRKNLTVTNSNWFAGTSYKGIQPSFIINDIENKENDIRWNDIEDIDYEMTFTKPNEGKANSDYSVDYKDGSFKTKFYAFHYDWNKLEPCNKPENTDENIEVLYYYETQMNVSVQYTFKDGAKSEWFEDSMISECYFRAAGKSLQPVYSKQEIKSTSPNKNKPKSLEDSYKSIDVVYENHYNRNCTEIKSVTKEAGKEASEKVYSVKKVKNTLFDNSSLYIAMRSMKLSVDYSQTISLFSAAEGGVSSYAVNGSETPLGDKIKAVSDELAKNGLYYPVTQDDEGNPIEDKGINTVAMNINNVSGNLYGTTQTVWYAAIENQDNNTARATMLKISIPVSYNLGTLNFTLKNINSTLWNGK